MNPSPGRIVLYCFRDRGTNMLTERPAIVTSVSSTKPGNVNLTVFFEIYDSDECASGRSGDPDFDPRYENVDQNRDSDREIPSQNTWRWPPRV